MLLKTGYVPVVIGPEQRLAYIEALQELQLRNHPAPYEHFMAGRLEASLDHHIAMLGSRGSESAPN